MVVRRRKKIIKKRGKIRARSGEIRRGAGNRGGRGKAGVGKKGTWHKRNIFVYLIGKYGFKRLHPKLKEEKKSINLSELDEKLDKWVEKGFAVKKDNIYYVDLDKLGYTKLLGKGRIEKKVIVTVSKASKKAIERIKELGGEVKLL